MATITGAGPITIRSIRASRCDIVTEVRHGRITAIGGNVTDSVLDKTIRTDANRRVIEPRYHAVVRVGAQFIKKNSKGGQK